MIGDDSGKLGKKNVLFGSPTLDINKFNFRGLSRFLNAQNACLWNPKPSSLNRESRPLLEPGIYWEESRILAKESGTRIVWNPESILVFDDLTKLRQNCLSATFLSALRHSVLCWLTPLNIFSCYLVSKSVMVSREWIKRPKLCPAEAHLFSWMIKETTNISSNLKRETKTLFY